MLSVFMRTLLVYLILTAAIRLIGKRQIGELQLSELITTPLLSELAVAPISDTSLPLFHAIIPILTLIVLEFSVSFCTSRIPRLRRLLYGAPSILIHKGKLNMREMKRLRMDISELVAELRLKDIADISEVHCAILEDNGKLSVFPAEDGAERGISLPLIVHGELMKKAMEFSDVDETWVMSRLKKHRIRQKDILLMSVDEQRRIIYILKNSPDGEILQKNEG